MLEHGAYTLLIDACYDRERFPTRDEAIEWAWARTPEEIDAVDFVLTRFFELVDGRYMQKRISEELDSYQQISETNKRIAQEREEKRRNRKRFEHEACSSVDEAPPNHKPLTINHKPITNTTEKDSAPSGLDVRFETFWKAYPKRVGKDAARKAFDKRKPDEAMLNSMLSAIQSQSLTLDWQKDGGQFIPHPATWLNQGRWQDELVSGEPTTNPLLLGAI